MKICTYGLWHLGSVTAACLAKAGFETVGVDDDASTVSNLSQGIPPLYEPGLEDLLKVLGRKVCSKIPATLPKATK